MADSFEFEANESQAPDNHRVLFVCTANMCRSPMAEGLATLALADRHPVTFRSAGFLAAGRPATDDAIRAAGALGADISRHRSALVREVINPHPDLIVCMTRQHLRSTVELDPALLGTTFTLAELVRLSHEHGPRWSNESLAEYLQRIGNSRTPRGLAKLKDPGDIADPIGKSPRHYADCANSIAEALEDLLQAVWPAATE